MTETPNPTDLPTLKNVASTCLRNSPAATAAVLDAVAELTEFRALAAGHACEWREVAETLDRQISALRADLAAAQAEISQHREFAKYVMSAVWEGCDTDAGDVQDAAEALGLIELRPCTPEQSIDGETEHFFLTWSQDGGAQRHGGPTLLALPPGLAHTTVQALHSVVEALARLSHPPFADQVEALDWIDAQLDLMAPDELSEDAALTVWAALQVVAFEACDLPETP